MPLKRTAPSVDPRPHAAGKQAMRCRILQSRAPYEEERSFLLSAAVWYGYRALGRFVAPPYSAAERQQFWGDL